jgi:hypothetical protein
VEVPVTGMPHTEARSVPFARSLAIELQDAADVSIDEADMGWTVTVSPRRPGARSVGWIDFGEQIIVQVGEFGGRWELAADEDDLAFLQHLTASVVAGRVSEVFGLRRSRVVVTLADGGRGTETGYDGLTGCLPLPLWPRWSRTVQYLPYRQRVAG